MLATARYRGVRSDDIKFKTGQLENGCLVDGIYHPEYF